MPTRLVDTVYGAHRHETLHTGRHFRADKPTPEQAAAMPKPIAVPHPPEPEPAPTPKAKNGKPKNKK